MNYCPLTLKACERECVRICRDAPNDKFPVITQEPRLAKHEELRARAAQGLEAREALITEVLSVAIPMQLRALREDRGWTQMDVSRRSGIAQSEISRLEQPGADLPSISTLKRLAAVFDVALLVSFESWENFLVFAAFYEDLPAPPAFSQDSLEQQF